MHSDEKKFAPGCLPQSSPSITPGEQCTHPCSTTRSTHTPQASSRSRRLNVLGPSIRCHPEISFFTHLSILSILNILRLCLPSPIASSHGNSVSVRHDSGSSTLHAYWRHGHFKMVALQGPQKAQLVAHISSFIDFLSGVCKNRVPQSLAISRNAVLTSGGALQIRWLHDERSAGCY